MGDELQIPYGQALQIARALEETAWRADPVLWAHDVQGFEPDAWQAQLLRSTSLDIIVNCSRQTGKTMMAGVRAAHYARYHPNSVILIASHTQKQATFVQYWVAEATRRANRPEDYQLETKEVEVFEPELTGGGGRIARRSVLSLELANGAKVESVPASPDTVRGYSPNLIIIDEAAYVPKEVYNSIRPMRAAKEVQLILLSSAGYKSGFFYEIWLGKMYGKEVADPWERVMVTADDCPRITGEFLKREAYELGVDQNSAFFRREYYCEFMDVEGGLFTREQIEAMFGNEGAQEMREEWLKEVDPFAEPGELDVLERVRGKVWTS